MQTNFDYFFTELMKDEGGYTDNPSDPGGPTNYGVTISDYRTYINPNGTAADVKKLTLSQAKVIYKKQYWDKLNCDSLPSGVDYCVADYGVNSGTARAARIYSKFNTIKDAPTLINAICDERVKFLQGLRTFPTFGKGWMNRMAHVRSVSLSLAAKPQPAVNPHVGVWTTITGAAAASYQWFHSHWQLIVICLVVAGIFTSIVISQYKDSKNGTVVK